MNFEDIVRVPYNTVPHMEKYEGPLLFNPPYRHHILEKHKELLFQGENIWFQSDLAYKHRLVYRACQVLGIEPVYDITNLGLKIQEDLVIVHRGRLEAAFVAFPSGWRPSDKQSNTLEELHEAVADGDVLRRASNKITQLMCGKYQYHRWVWTLTPWNHLSAHPDYVCPEANSLDEIWLRTEHQKTFVIEEGLTSGFLIDVHLTPYWILNDGIRNKIKESINSMSAEVLIYKKLEKIKQLINA